MKETKTKRIKVCKNCPKIGNHVHYEGKIYAVSKGAGEVEFAEFKGMKSWSSLTK